MSGDFLCLFYSYVTVIRDMTPVGFSKYQTTIDDVRNGWWLVIIKTEDSVF